MYIEALQEIVNTVSNDELVEKARGFLILVTDELWLLDIYFLGAITRILKRFSTQFQISGLTSDGYVNLVGQVKMALKNLKIVSPNAASQYFLVEYTEHLAKPLMVDPTQRASRSRLTDGQDAVDSRVSGLQERTHLHQKVVEGLLKWAKKYWFEHEYWQRQRNNVLRLENMGYLLNMISENFQVPLEDPVNPLHHRCRCTTCNKLFPLTDTGSHGKCVATWITIPSLVGSFKRVSKVVPDALKDMVDNSEVLL